MSKTYNDKYDFNKILDEESNYWDAHLLATRHPNKRKRSSLNREFHKVHLGSPANWKNREMLMINLLVCICLHMKYQ